MGVSAIGDIIVLISSFMFGVALRELLNKYRERNQP